MKTTQQPTTEESSVDQSDPVSEMSNEQKWAISLEGETYGAQYDSREEAIQNGILEWEGNPFWVGRCVDPPQPEDLWHARDWLEHVSCQDAYSVECAEDWNSDIRTCNIRELESEVREVMAEWLDRTKNRPTFYIIEDAEEIFPNEDEEESK